MWANLFCESQFEDHKFSVDGAAMGKPSPVGIGGVLHDDKGRMPLIFSKSVGVMESNESELRAIRRATHLWASLGNVNLIIEGDFANAIAWASGRKNPP